MKSTRIHERLKESVADTLIYAAPHAAIAAATTHNILKNIPRKKGKKDKISPETKKFVKDLPSKKKEPLSD